LVVVVEVAVVERDGHRVARQRRSRGERTQLVDTDDREMLLQAQQVLLELAGGRIDHAVVELFGAVVFRKAVISEDTEPGCVRVRAELENCRQGTGLV
jgi:hypothetical protein